MHDIFCFTDIHGCRPLFDAIMNYCKKQDDEATIIFCGDACDRGPDGYTIMKELLENPKVIYLMGNHEDMFTRAAREIIEKFNFKNTDRDRVKTVLSACKAFDYKYAAIQDSLYNGGMPTLLDWIMDGMPMDFVEHIEQLPRTFSYEDKDFCHSGGVYQTFQRVSECEYEMTAPNLWDTDAIVWNRSALDIGWAPNRMCIFGHTPTPYLSDYIKIQVDKAQPVKYASTSYPIYTGEKLDMDTGTIFTGKAYVLNVLTMRAQGFELKNDEVEEIEVIQL